ncbi:hypothetical protein TRAPUB_6019 [Trametes pubescens]|uniref:Uncharacterized protein n=1 Tax=Trametes pubescens TaxID=154538 RepID=A0A1M2V6U0_TRAPU|nr:hypothetical protein TRAPUB_6019 [Trametes pubescens]
MSSTQTFKGPDLYQKSQVSIPSVTPNWSLDAWKYLPSGHGKQKPPQGWPVIIMFVYVVSNHMADILQANAQGPWYLLE